MFQEEMERERWELGWGSTKKECRGTEKGEEGSKRKGLAEREREPIKKRSAKVK